MKVATKNRSRALIFGKYALERSVGVVASFESPYPRTQQRLRSRMNLGIDLYLWDLIFRESQSVWIDLRLTAVPVPPDRSLA
jgi:hypothetical protein